MPIFSLLHDPTNYYPCTQNMLTDQPFREFWLDYIVSHTVTLIVPLAEQTYGPNGAVQARACAADLTSQMERLRRQPDFYGELNLQTLASLRQTCLRHYGIPDPFLVSKQRENRAMLALYPAVIADLDRCTDPAKTLQLLVEGVFAGNIFDLGASATAGQFADTSPDFLKVRASLADRRPWLVDHFDAFAPRLLRGDYHKTLFFMDNAGSDAILGVLPLARWLARRGGTVCLLANEAPALNDITIAELRAVLDRTSDVDPLMRELLAAGRIAAASSGGTTPLLDLRQVSDECNAQAADADLLFFEGMGRGLESNFRTAFRVDTVKLCMIKEEIIAAKHGGKVFDVVFRFDPAAR